MGYKNAGSFILKGVGSKRGPGVRPTQVLPSWVALPARSQVTGVCAGGQDRSCRGSNWAMGLTRLDLKLERGEDDGGPSPYKVGSMRSPGVYVSCDEIFLGI